MLAFGTHPDIEAIPCIVESELDIGYWGNPDLVSSENKFLEFIRFQKYDYILIAANSIDFGGFEYDIIERLITDNEVLQIISEDDNLLLTMNSEKVDKPDDIRTALEVFHSVYKIDGDDFAHATDIEGRFEDGWCTDVLEFNLGAKDKALIYFDLYCPIAAENADGKIDIFFDDEYICSEQIEQNMVFSVPIQGKEQLHIKMVANFSADTNNGDQRSLCYFVNNIYSSAQNE